MGVILSVEMRRWTVLLVVSLVLPILGVPGRAAENRAAASLPDTDAHLAWKIDRQVARVERLGAVVGAQVVEVESGRSRFEHNADTLLIPASNVKLATTAAALDLLGPGYFFETRLLARGPVRNGVLTGDLAVVGGGDPAISWRTYPYPADPFAVFRRWAHALEEQGIERVEGDLLLIHGLFPAPWVHPDWKEKNRYEWYQVPVAALGFHENVVRLRALPAERPGRPARVEVFPPVPGFEPRLRVVTTASWRRHGLRVEEVARGEQKGAPPGDEFPGRESLGGESSGGAVQLTGGVFRGAGPLDEHLAVDDPVRYFGAALLTALEQEDLTVSGSLRAMDSLPGLTWREMAAHRTDLLTVVEITNRESQNLFAESLIKVLGAEVCGRGTWERGSEAVRGFLTGIGLDPRSYSLRDGSGLSRSNRFTARQLTALLRALHDHPWSAELVGSLPRGGQEGTSLEDRFEEPRYGSRVAAKTGTLDGVSALSGYVRGRSGRLYAFSILINFRSGKGPVWRARRTQDAIVRTLVDNG